MGVCLGFRITANHCGIKMFTGRGGISSELMILMLLFLPCEVNVLSVDLRCEKTVNAVNVRTCMHCCACVFMSCT